MIIKLLYFNPILFLMPYNTSALTHIFFKSFNRIEDNYSTDINHLFEIHYNSLHLYARDQQAQLHNDLLSMLLLYLKLHLNEMSSIKQYLYSNMSDFSKIYYRQR